ncbi:C39 family peptidase [Rhodococcus rhodochrous]|uniref:C39 family peptidase n=1 Tax=Rhodococcus rhodochrous TaxID=1829 RepID=A0AA46X1P8_RHORH|nr:C39 family peptidase [Rhodococcus rhodochrous]UZF48483.1 C39 family peptidase [Rhodococcus rhodochrous]
MVTPRRSRPQVPYYAQWESPELVGDLLTGRTRAENDPYWARSGAKDPTEYAFWSWKTCGVACLRMALASMEINPPTVMSLVEDLVDVGAYRLDGVRVHGLVYAPFVEYVNAQDWSLTATVAAPLEIGDLRLHLEGDGLALISVHPTIRDLTPQSEPPPLQREGGHLVLAIASTDQHIVFHNPSGWPGRSQVEVAVQWTSLEPCFARRGILLTKEETP